MNIHPSLLPKYTGLNTHQRAIDAGDSEAGATVHYVTNELDGGPAILQARVTIEDLDTAETLASKVLEVEHCIFPEAVNWHLQERVVHAEQGAYLDGKLCHQMVYLGTYQCVVVACSPVPPPSQYMSC